MWKILEMARRWWRLLLLTGTPLLLLPLPAATHASQAGLCAYVMLVMAVYWVSEVLPMGVTALLPVLAFPLLGVIPAKKVAVNYFQDVNFLLMGGLLIALSIEKCNLHRRIALRVLMLVGSKPQWIMFGFMTTTGFLSMWLSNTATTAMMTPIAHAVILALDANRRRHSAGKKNCGDLLLQNVALKHLSARDPGNATGADGVLGADGVVGTDGVVGGGGDGVVGGGDGESYTVEDAGYNKMCHVTVLPEVTSPAGRHKHLSNGSSSRHTSLGSDLGIGDGAKNPSCPLRLPNVEVRVYSREDSGEDDALADTTPPQGTSLGEKHEEKQEEEQEEEKRFARLSIGMKICIAYAANIGGSATLTGTPPHLVLKGILDQLYGSENDIGFSSWMVFGLPNMIITLFLSWLWLQLLYIGPRAFTGCFKADTKTEDDPSSVIRKEYRKLGKISYAEKAVLVHFVILVILWLAKDPAKGSVYGWASLPFIKPGFVTDATVAVAVCLSLFLFPSKPVCGRPSWLCRKKRVHSPQPKSAPNDGGAAERHRHESAASRVTWKDTDSAVTEITQDDGAPHRLHGSPPPLLEWRYAMHNMSWGVLFIFGAGMALADGCKESGLSAAIGEYLTRFGGWPVWLLVLVLCTVTALLTELTSNTATATIFLPIIANLAESIGVNPLYLMIPTALSCSFAFMLPIATPPNAIVFAYGGLSIKDMMQAGAVMNVISIAVLQFTVHTYAFAYLSLGDYPTWAPTAAVSNSSIQYTTP